MDWISSALMSVGNAPESRSMRANWGMVCLLSSLYRRMETPQIDRPGKRKRASTALRISTRRMSPANCFDYAHLLLLMRCQLVATAFAAAILEVAAHPGHQ